MASIIRNVARSTRTLQGSRALSVSAVSRKDFVQELYLTALKAYKAPPAAKDAHVGVVKSINIPSAPEPPKLPSDLASELQAYASAEPTLADAAPAATTASALDGAGGADAFLHFLEQDLPKEDAHH